MSVDHEIPQDADSLKFRFDLTIADFDAVRRYAKTHLADGKPKPRTSKFVWAWLVIVPGTFAVTLMISAYNGEQVFVQPKPEPVVVEREPASPVVSWVVLLLIAAFIYGVIRGLIQNRKQRRAFAASPDLLGRECKMSSDGVTFASESSLTAYRWRVIHRIVLTKPHLLFVVADNQANILPRSAVGDVEQTIRTLACIRKWYSGPVIDEEGKPLTAANSLNLE